MTAHEPDLGTEPAVPQEEPPRPHGDEAGDLAAPGGDTGPAGPDGPPEDGLSEVPAPPTADDVDVPRLLEERAEYLDAYQRTRAEFENYKKRVMARQADEVARAAESIVDKLLPVLDACESAIDHGHRDVEPVFAALLGTLEKEGLTRVHPGAEPFDPNLHEAVIHEPGEGGESVVVEVLRTGYTWKGRLLRPAMVKVKG
ncbi:MAG TPA: nucleotide exchange factor GrpE [Acidimicrobiales bacterium]|jgi:molecular chaperone GrpE